MKTVKTPLVALLVAASFVFGPAANVHAQQPDQARRVIVFVWDGLRMDDLTPEITPNYFALARSGVVFADHHAVYPTFTMMNSASIATGTYPGVHGFYGNVVYAPRRMGITAKTELDEIVERCLRQSVLWDEVKDRLDMLGTRLSGGQQQRLTLARALSLSPEILCLDEFSIAIDPVTTMRIEDVLKQLKQKMTIILVTNLVQQARRLADHTLFLWRGEVVELSPTAVAFSDNPKDRRTYDYVNGIFG